MNTKLFLFLGAFLTLMFSGCAPKEDLAPKDVSEKAKLFNLPKENKAGVYIYRDSSFGAALKKNLYIDGKFIAESSPYMFFYVEIEGDKEHKFSTSSEFSRNNLFLKTEKNKLYFIRQYMKIGLFTGASDLELVEEDIAKKAILDSDMELGNTN